MFGRLVLAACLGLLALVSGCRDSGPEIAEVEGVVRLNGKPQRGLLVRFLPEPNQGISVPVYATGTTDEQGKYVLEYSYPGKEGKGTAVGRHRVLVTDATLPFTPQGRLPPPSRVPLNYASAAKTPLSVEVLPGEQTIDLDVKR